MPGIVRPLDHTQRELKVLSKSYIPGVWLFLDTETRPATVDGVTSEYFYLGWSCLWIRPKGKGHGHADWVFHDTESGFNLYLVSIVARFKNIFIVGHNIFFDLQAAGTFEYLTRQMWELDFYYDKGLTYIFKCIKGKNTFTVLSTTNWFDQSLESLGKALKLPKGKVDFKTATDAELKKYCRRDVEILVRAIKHYLTFITKHDLGKFSFTKASQAFSAYRSKFMDHKIMIHTDPDVQDLERSAYIGGRVECFELGEITRGPFVTLDVNSMYPFVMSENLYPWQLVDYEESPDMGKFLSILKGFAVIAEIEVDTPVACFAVKYKGKTVFPIGRFNCFVCSEGLAYALQNGFVVKIRRASIYRKTDLFTGYVEYFHKLRLNYTADGNDIMLLLCKYMHNGLYGKFGQLEIVTDIQPAKTGRDYYREEIFDMTTNQMVVVTTFMNMEIVQYPGGEGKDSNVAIAAHITENARFYLWDLMNQAGLKKVLYCDTDGFKIRAADLAGVKDLIKPGVPGALKIENRSSELFIGGAKNYRTEDTRKIKGIPRTAKEITPGVFQFQRFISQVGHMREGQIRGAQVKTVTRELRAIYNKGRITPTGKVRPFKFPLS